MQLVPWLRYLGPFGSGIHKLSKAFKQVWCVLIWCGVVGGIMCPKGTKSKTRGRRMEPSPLGLKVHWERDNQWNHWSISEGEDSSTMFQSVHADFRELHTWSRHPTAHNGWCGGKLKLALELQENADAEKESINTGGDHIYLDTLSFCIDVTNDGLWAANVHNEHGMTSDSTGTGTGLTCSSFEIDSITSHKTFS